MNSIKDKLDVDVDFSRIREIQIYVNNLVRYVGDPIKHKVSDYWQWATETLDFLTGDCEDSAILMIALAYQKLGLKCNLVVVGRVKDGKKVYHAIVEYGDTWYDSTSNDLIKVIAREWIYQYRISFFWLNTVIRWKRFWNRKRLTK